MKKKNVLIAALSVSLVGIIAIGATFALLSSTTEKKVNHFTMATKGIAIELREPTWDNDPFTGEQALVIEDAALGKNLAQNIVPLRQIPKNPTVKNTGDHDAWIAVKLDYTMNSASVTYDELMTLINFDVDSTQWTANADKTVFYFNAKFAVGAKATLFDKVTIDDVATVSPFDIGIKAYAVQYEGLDFAAAQTALNDLMK